MVSRLECRHRRPDVLNDADALVTENATRLASWDVTLEDVQIGTANCRLRDFDDRVRGSRDVGLRTVLQSFLAWPLIHEGLHHAGRCGAIAGFGIVSRAMVYHLSGRPMILDLTSADSDQT